MIARVCITVAVLAAAMTAVFRIDRQTGRVVGTMGAPFEMIDAKSGKTFSERDLRGHPAALFFGFTHCADVCPTALITAGRWLKELGRDADALRFVFVSVDPERDTPESLALYLKSFDPRIIGLTGSRAHTNEMLERYGVVAIKRESSGTDYAYDHTSLIQLFDRDGQFAGTVDFDDPSEVAIAKLRALD